MPKQYSHNMKTEVTPKLKKKKKEKTTNIMKLIWPRLTSAPFATLTLS